jgi:TolB-like protein
MEKTSLKDKTIAVLPFVNLSGKDEFEYFSDGITEEIINALARIPQLKVTSRTSSFYFKQKSVSIRDIARELGVATILEGSVRMASGTLRITAQLIHAEEDFHFWSEVWDRKLENIFEIQDEISLLIADKLREQYGHLEINDHLVPRKTESLDTWEYAMKARYHFNKWNPADVQEAIGL